MGSPAETTPTCQGWNSSFIFTNEERMVVERGPFSVKSVVLDGAFDYASITVFCDLNSIPPDLLFKVAWSIIVGFYAGTNDVCFQVELLTARTALRCRLDAAKSIKSLAESLEEVVHDEVVSAAPSDKTLSNGIFDTSLQISRQDGPSQTSSIKPEAATSNSTQGILLSARVDINKATFAVDYPDNIWTEQQATRTIKLFSHIVAEIVANSTLPLKDLGLLPPDDLVEINGWNANQLEHYQVSIHQAVADQTAISPDNQAICGWDGNLTYRELDTLSSRLAWKLRKLGVEPASTVTFLFPKSKWTIVALLAILKAGGVAVAFSSEYPVERVRHIAEMSNAKLLLVGKGLEDMFELPGVTKFTVDDQSLLSLKDTADEAAHRSLPEMKPSDAAYIQFTSGSTGQPKGIVIEHGSFLANALAHLGYIQLNNNSRTLEFAAHTFDAFLTEVLMTLLAGGCICIPSEEARVNDLTSVINELSVNWIGMTPTLARVLNPADVPGLKTVCLWGEMAPRELIATWADSVELINCYGPSENSVGATVHSFSSGSRNPSCIGRAVKNVNAWIVRVDNRNKLAPIGAVGELVLQGPTVARGYLLDPSRTNDKFVTSVPWLDSNDSSPSQRGYFTGDLVRYTSDGQMEFCGRRDTAVKIRGQRVELGEIEHHIIHSDQGYAASSVMVIGTPHMSTETLVAFISETGANSEPASKPGSILQNSSSQVRSRAALLESHLSNVLTRAAVPMLYLPLHWIPSLPSGKVDRQRLLALVASLTDTELAEYSAHSNSIKEAPHGEMESLFAQLWNEILGVDAHVVSRNDNFFYLGGNSILAMRLTVAARKRNISISVDQVLKNPRLADIASLASSIKLDSPETTESGYLPFSTLSKVLAEDFVNDVAAPKLSVSATDVEDVGLATDYQIENLAWSSLKKRGGTNYVTLDFSDSLDPQRLHQACERLVAHHAILRTVYLVHRRRVYQVALKQLPFDIIHSNAQDVVEATSTIMDADLRQPLDISKALIKFWFIIINGNVKRLVLRASHLQYDGVALIRWCKELNLAYAAQELGPTPSFAEYSYYAANHDPEGARNFWRKLLAGSSMTRVFNHKEIPWKNVLDGQVDGMIDSSLLQCSPDITVGTVMKAAWALVLAEMARTSDVVFGSVVWGRNAAFPDVEDVSGACIDNIPVRVRITKDMSRLSLLQQVQEQYFEAINFESFQFKRIVQECTDWKPWERLSTLVEYENLGEDTSRFPIDGNKHFTVDEVRPPADRHDITIYSMPLGDKTFIALDFCKALLDESLAQVMFDRLLAHIKDFKQDINGIVELKNSVAPIPIFQGTSDSVDNSESCGTNGAGDANSGIGINTELRWLRRIVENAWTSILSSREEQLSQYWATKKPFFEVWGNLIAATGLSKWYTAEGFNISMEDVLENPDMASQVELLRLAGNGHGV
ncbi:putative non-ribosomal peptide synthase [Trichoderma pleuroticola]